MRPPNIMGNLGGTIRARGIKQDISQPSCIRELQIECLTKYPSLMPTARVCRTQAVLLKFANIENGLIAARHAAHRDNLGQISGTAASSSRKTGCRRPCQ